MARDYETGRPTDETPRGITTRDDFGEYLLRVLGDYRAAGATEWTNTTLDGFLDGLSAFALTRARDQPGQEQEQPSWQLFAEIIAAATGYE